MQYHVSHSPHAMPSPSPCTLTRRQFAGLLGLSCASAASASDAAPYPKFKRGINLHHLLNWPDTIPDRDPVEYVWPPFATPGYDISDAELARLRQMKLDFLRVTADPSIFLATQGAKRVDLIQTVKARMQRLLGAGFTIIFDLHPVNVNPAFAPLKLVESVTCPALRSYGDVVEELARALHPLPHDRFAFELMNEPWLDGREERARWQPMMEMLHKRARTGSSTLPLVLTGAAWSSIGALMELDVSPFAGSNVLYTFHYYDPHTFTHQGVEGDEAAYLSQLKWPAAHDDIAQVKRDAFAAIEALKQPAPAKAERRAVTDKLLNDYELTAHNEERLKSEFDMLSRWLEKNRISPDRVYLGEFGCVNAGYNKKPLGNERADWLQRVRLTAESHGFGWALWAYKGYGGMGLLDDKGVLDESAAKALEL